MAIVRQIVDRVFAVVREEGTAAALAKIARVAQRQFRRRVTDDFDAAFNVDTSEEVSLWRLDISSENASNGSKYQTTHPRVFLTAINLVPADIRNFTFIDLGCGKGRTLILAAQCGFKKVIGVEFSPELASIARRNIGQLDVCADIVEMDVTRFTFVDDNLLIYMYNPFGRPVMRSVINNLLLWRKRQTRDAFVVYINPVCEYEITSCGSFEPVVSSDELRIWKLQ